MNQNISRTHGFEPLHIEGTVPDQLAGTLYRVGPGLMRKFGRDVHPFLADGLITAVEITAEPRGACELVQDTGFREEAAAGRSLYDMNASGLRRLYNGLTGKVKNTGNTNVLAWDRQLFALMEQGHPVRFDRRSLDTLGATDLGVIRGSFSAHPHRVEALKTTFNFGVEGRRIHVYALPDGAPARALFSIEAPWASLIHDFIVTEKHAVFFIDPGKLVVWRAMLGSRDFAKYFHWDETGSTVVIVVPFDAPEDEIRIEVDPFRVWHFANAYVDGEELVVDAFRHRNIDVLAEPASLSSDIPAPELYRFRISLRQRTMHGERCTTGASEFPSVNPLYLGRAHRYVWMQTYVDADGGEGIARFDSHTGEHRRYRAPDGHRVSEPMFIPIHDGEAPGWLLQLTLDPGSDRSYLAVFDAEGFTDGPAAKLWFDHAIPPTFHGTFVPVTAGAGGTPGETGSAG